MNNTNQTTTPNQTNQAATATTANEAPNRKFVIQTLGKLLSADQIKQILADPDLDKGWNEDRVEKVLLPEDEDKLKDYKELEVKDLPFDWKIKIERLKELEKKQANYNQIEKDLADWNNTFENKKPVGVQEEIKDLTTNLTNTKQELNDWKEKHNLIEGKLREWQQTFPNSIPSQVKEQIEELETKLSEWTNTWENRELSEVKEEWEDLKKRPDVALNEQEWWDDYTHRPSLTKTKQKEEELVKEKEKNEELRQKNQKLFSAISNFLKKWRTRRYATIDSTITILDAQKKIAELLEETEREWNDYLEKINISDKNLVHDLSSWDNEKNKRAYQVLAWIKEARTTLDYQTLFERWSAGKEYNEEHDYDGTLYLLAKYLEVKDFEPTNTNNQQ